MSKAFNTDLLPLQQFLFRANLHPNEVYLNQPVNRQWSSYTWSDVELSARKIASGLLAQGFKSGDKIALLSKNCAQWVMSELAVAMAGMISVPIYSTAGKDTIEYVVEHSEAVLLIVGRLDDYQTVNASQLQVPTLALPYTAITDAFRANHQWNQWLDKYPPLQDIADPLAEDTYTIVYTSGSTGQPKGVVLSSLNMAMSTLSIRKLYEDDTERARVLSYLPMAHITERSVVTMVSFYTNVALYFTESLETFVEDIHYVKPTHFVSVPRLWAKFQAGILQKMPDEKLQRLIKIPIIRRMVINKIKKGLGLDKCVSFASGSAPISPSLLKWYESIDIDIAEGWGMSETAGAACSNMPYVADDLGTIGRSLETVEMKIGDNDELLIRGPSIFKNYYKNPEVTQASFVDGWFKTGDKARQLDNGSWVITGRVKEQFKTAKGKYVSPVPIESLLFDNSYIEQCCVLGIGKPQPMALVYVNCLATVEQSNIAKSLEATLQMVNTELESHQRLSNIIVTSEPWSIENDLLTPTLKLKRENIEQYYQHLINAEHPSVIIFE